MVTVKSTYGRKKPGDNLRTFMDEMAILNGTLHKKKEDGRQEFSPTPVISDISSFGGAVSHKKRPRAPSLTEHSPVAKRQTPSPEKLQGKMTLHRSLKMLSAQDAHFDGEDPIVLSGRVSGSSKSDAPHIGTEAHGRRSEGNKISTSKVEIDDTTSESNFSNPISAAGSALECLSHDMWKLILGHALDVPCRVEPFFLKGRLGYGIRAATDNDEGAISLENNDLSILRTCTAFYAAGTEIFYGSTSFCFNDPWACS